VPKKPNQIRQAAAAPSPVPAQKKWWEIATDLITKTDGLVKGIAALVGVIALVWGLGQKATTPKDAGTPKTPATSTETAGPDDANSPSRAGESLVGWMYVGARKDEAWWSDNSEPRKTLDVDSIPSPGSQYEVIAGVFLRKSPPTELPNGARPSMEPIVTRDGKQLAVRSGMRVKVDNIRKVEVAQVPDVQRTWIWAHVTVLDR